MRSLQWYKRGAAYFGLRTKLNGKSTYSVFEKSPTDLAFPSAADFQFTDFHRFPG